MVRAEHGDRAVHHAGRVERDLDATELIVEPGNHAVVGGRDLRAIMGTSR
jgi:hypothetical protein